MKKRKQRKIKGSSRLSFVDDIENGSEEEDCENGKDIFLDLRSEAFRFSDYYDLLPIVIMSHFILLFYGMVRGADFAVIIFCNFLPISL